MSAGDVLRIESGWSWLCRRPGHLLWETNYALWLRWIDRLAAPLAGIPWSNALAPVMASLAPGFVHPANPLVDAEATPCLLCGTRVWRGEVDVLGEPQTRRCRVGPEFLPLNAEPDARGRWFVQRAGMARFATGVDLIDWPLPRYTSHLVTCSALIRRRKEEEAEMTALSHATGEKRKRLRAEREARLREKLGV